MTDEEKNKMFYKVFNEFKKTHKECFHFSDHIYARDLFDICCKNFKCYEETLKKEYAELKIKYAELKKNALEWHKVTCFDKPDENGWITCDAPSVSGIVYLVKLKDGGHEIRELEEYDGCTFFEDLEWEEIEAWAEFPEV